jgi:hypothetical protein
MVDGVTEEHPAKPSPMNNRKPVVLTMQLT